MIIAKLEPEFMPMAKVLDDYKAAVAKAENQEIIISVERTKGSTTLLAIRINTYNEASMRPPPWMIRTLPFFA